MVPASFRVILDSLRSAFIEGGTVAKNYLNFIIDRMVIEGDRVRIVGKAAEAMHLMEAVNAASPPWELTKGGEVLATVRTRLRMLGSNQRQVG